MLEGYCVKCKEKINFEPTETKSYFTSRGEKTCKLGTCPVCKTKISRMVKKE